MNHFQDVKVGLVVIEMPIYLSVCGQAPFLWTAETLTQRWSVHNSTHLHLAC